ncbi:hypothetical protein BH23PLA1_BH23PLA1_27700 [soil metagenome]
MNHHDVEDRAALSPTDARPMPGGLLRWVYNNNPFYVISACLVFLGLRASFDAQGRLLESGALMGGLAAYTLLLAATAVAVVRLGRVWDDARTILLLVVLLFLAISVTFDETLAADPALGRLFYLGGLLFSVVVSESLLRGMGLRMRALYRLPYYLILGLFFAYPVALSPWLDRPETPELQWALFGFSTVAGLAFLTLLPAVRRGPKYLEKNGSPWRWPLYPWVLFGLLGVVAAARSYSLCVSFHFVAPSPVEMNMLDSRSYSMAGSLDFLLGSRLIFGPYFLIPLLLAWGVLLLEMGLVSGRRLAQRVALVLPLGLLAMAMGGHRPDPIYRRFLELLADGLGGTPAFLTLLAALGFYVYAMLRGVRKSAELLTIALAILSVVGPETLRLGDLRAPEAWPLALAAGLQLSLALRRRDSYRCLIAAGCVSLAVSAALPAAWSPAERFVVALHLLLAGTLAIGAVFEDGLGQLLRRLGAGGLLLAILAGVIAEPRPFGALPSEVLRAYPILMTLISAGYGAMLGDTLYLRVAAGGLLGWLAMVGGRSYAALRQVVGGLDQISLGLAFFLLAAGISLWKAGMIQKWLTRRTDEG